MRHGFKYVFCSFLLVPVITVVFLAVSSGPAKAQDCDIFICKSAEGSENTEFHFTGTSPFGPLDFTLISVGEDSCEFFSIPLTQSLVVFEDPTPGWVLSDVECTDVIGVDILFPVGGVRLTCEGPNLGSARCTFFNVLLERPIPTLSQWGMISAAVGLGLVGVWFAMRRRKIFNT